MNPDITNNPPPPTDPNQGNTYKLFKPEKPCPERSEWVSSFIFYLAILFFMIGFNFSDVMVGNWYQQFMPNINGRTIVDITFTDSLTGYAVTSLPTLTDTAFILKTSDGGDSWVINHKDSAFIFKRIQFIDQNTGFAGGTHLSRTTNAGANWTIISQSLFFDDMHVLNFDTIWFAKSEGLTGGVFFTSNGGANWQQINLGSQNPSKIYMYNARIGFVSKSTGQILYRTTNSGINWSTLPTAGAFTDMYFADSLTGWKSGAPGGPGFRKTTDGGLNWFDQILPSGGNIVSPQIEKLSGLNKDTIWGVGAFLLTSLGFRGMIHRTTNGGDNWLFQVPDTAAIQIGQYDYIDFVNKLNGWAYRDSPTGIHTTSGGDPVWYTPIHQISTEVPKEYRLFNNYPNPFNPTTNIKYQIINSKYVRIVVYDIQGKEVTTIVNQKQQAGTYEVDFNGTGYSSGVYFYRIEVRQAGSSTVEFVQSKKMVLVK